MCVGSPFLSIYRFITWLFFFSSTLCSTGRWKWLYERHIGLRDYLFLNVQILPSLEIQFRSYLAQSLGLSNKFKVIPLSALVTHHGPPSPLSSSANPCVYTGFATPARIPCVYTGILQFWYSSFSIDLLVPSLSSLVFVQLFPSCLLKEKELAHENPLGLVRPLVVEEPL